MILGYNILIVKLNTVFLFLRSCKMKVFCWYEDNEDGSTQTVVEVTDSYGEEIDSYMLEGIVCEDKIKEILTKDYTGSNINFIFNF